MSSSGVHERIELRVPATTFVITPSISRSDPEPRPKKVGFSALRGTHKLNAKPVSSAKASTGVAHAAPPTMPSPSDGANAVGAVTVGAAHLAIRGLPQETRHDRMRLLAGDRRPAGSPKRTSPMIRPVRKRTP